MLHATGGEVRKWPAALKNRALADAVLRDDKKAVRILLAANADGGKTRDWKGLSSNTIEEVAIEVGSHNALAALVKKRRQNTPSWEELCVASMRADQGACFQILTKKSTWVEWDGVTDDVRESVAKDAVSRGLGEKIGRLMKNLALCENVLSSLADFAEVLGRDVEKRKVKNRLASMTRTRKRQLKTM